MSDLYLDSFIFDKKLLNDCKEMFRRLFLNKMKYIVLLSENSFITTNVTLFDLLTNTFSSSCVVHLVDVNDIALQDTLKKLLAFNENNRYSYLSRDYFLSFLNAMEKLYSYYNSLFKPTKEELDKVFTLTPKRKPNGEVLISFSKPLRDFLTLFDYLISLDHLTYTNEKEQLIAENLPKGPIIKTIASLFHLSKESKKYKKLNIGETTTHKIITSVLGNYISHINSVLSTKENLLEENINKTNEELNDLKVYSFQPKSKLNSFFQNRSSLSLVIHLMPGINHPVPSKIEEFKLSLLLWKEDGSIRHLTKYATKSYNVISFLPNSTFFLLKDE